nr:DNA polymerase-like [Tanacetum cinerariifolium]
MDIDSMLGFIEAYAVCLKTINKPILPYHSKTGTLIFPTGEFIGVYYSEELKYAVGLGYKVVPISGYLFERSKSIKEGTGEEGPLLCSRGEVAAL